MSPFRGSWKSITAMTVVYLIGCGSIALGFLGLYQPPIDFIHSLLH